MQLPIELDEHNFRLSFGENMFAPDQEVRTLDSIRESLLDPSANGPEVLYVIAMDIGLQEHRAALLNHGFLFGIVAYSPGQVGREPVRSQGHVHKPSPGHNVSPPELFEIWEGDAVVYMQESVEDNPGRCFAVHASAGETVLCPPGWAHMVVNSNPDKPMVFLALCDRDYAGFDYSGVRRHGGLAHFPVVSQHSTLEWQPNETYIQAQLKEKGPAQRWYSESVAEQGLYGAAIQHPEQFQAIPRPDLYTEYWSEFQP